ncbi:MAG: hypothetical protein Q9214_006209, partial [Letrouitia sp. 1 TL-2023]
RPGSLCEIKKPTNAVKITKSSSLTFRDMTHFMPVRVTTLKIVATRRNKLTTLTTVP